MSYQQPNPDFPASVALPDSPPESPLPESPPPESPPPESPCEESEDVIISMGKNHKPMKLLPHQIDHYRRLSEILHTEHGYLDTSPMGSGKTFTTMAIAATFNLSLGIVCPLSIIDVWKQECATYGIPIKFAISYQSLRGTKSSAPKHGLLDRLGDQFKATDKFKMMVKKGLLLVFDEVHNLKNATSQLQSAHCLVKQLVKLNCGSRVALLSATPCDKPAHISSLLKILGIIEHDDLYEYDMSKQEYTLLGMQEIIDKCATLSKLITHQIVGSIVLTRQTMPHISYELFIRVIKPRVCSAMEPVSIVVVPGKEDVIKECKNGYYEMMDKDVETLREGANILSRATRYRSDTQQVQIGKGSWGAITRALGVIERSKVQLMIRLAKEKLADHPNNKVILYFSFIESIKSVKEALAEYNPLVMYGITKAHERAPLIKKFQEPSSEYRLMILNARVGGIGISLDDRDGNFPRYMFIVPNYNFIDLQQATGRIYRSTTQSSATIRFVYSKAFPNETSIIDSLFRKAKLLKSIVVSSNELLPGEYPVWIEGEGDKVV